MCSKPKAKLEKGFTLIELGITLAVISILLSMAVPAYMSSAAENRVFSFTEALKADVQWARAQAIAQNTYTTVNFTNSSCSTWTISVNGTVAAGRGMTSSELAANYPGVTCSFTGTAPSFNGEGMWITKFTSTNLNVLTQACVQSGSSNCTPTASSGFSGFSNGANNFVATVSATGANRTWQIGVGGFNDLRMVAQ